LDLSFDRLLMMMMMMMIKQYPNFVYNNAFQTHTFNFLHMYWLNFGN